MHKYFRRMATDIFLYAANVSKVVEGGRGLPCIRLTVTRYFIDMNVSHRTPMFVQCSSQIVSLEFSFKLLTFTLHTFVLTQKSPSPSPMLSHVYFGALRHCNQGRSQDFSKGVTDRDTIRGSPTIYGLYRCSPSCISGLSHVLSRYEGPY